MTEKKKLAQHRAELLVELFLTGLHPAFAVHSPETVDMGYDYLVGFTNPLGGINTYAVLFRATDRAVPTRYPIPRPLRERMAHSNLPVLFMVVDGLQDKLYYAWPADEDAFAAGTVSLTEIDDAVKRQLRRRLTKVDRATMAVA